jgi:parallel beta-helix repeat protein
MIDAFRFSRLVHTRAGLGIALLLVSACSGDNPSEPSSNPSISDHSGLTVAPSAATVGVDQTVQFSATTDTLASGVLRRWRYNPHPQPRPGDIVRIAVSPRATTLEQDGKSTFKAEATLSDGSVVGTTVGWSATGGAIDSTGLYRAGSVTGVYRVIGTAKNGVADTARVTVTAVAPTVARVEVTPATTEIPAGAAKQFTAVGYAGDGSALTIRPVFTATGGTISSAGSYSAGATPGAYRVVARDSASGKADTSVVTIIASGPTLQAVVLTPSSVSLDPGASQQFTAVGRLSDGSTESVPVSWTATGGSISPSGNYTAGQTPGTYRVIASSSGKADTAAVVVKVAGSTPAPSPGPGIQVRPGESIQAAVNANPGGTVFRILAGVHRRQSVVPKSGNQFLGEPGAILDGERAAVYAFDRGGDNVTIKGLVIRNYNTPVQMGSIRGDGTRGWVVDSNEVTESRGGGIRLGHKMKVRWNNVHHNHQLGLAGGGDSVLVEGNEIAFNNWLKENNWGWEAGGTKFTFSRWLVVRNNYSHDNWGPGLWTDIDNIYTTYEGNRIEDNAGPGIYHEISYNAIMRNNTIKRNGFDFSGWIWGGGIQISASQNVEVYGNTLEDNRMGVSVVEQARGSGAYGPYVTRNNYVHDNTIRQSSGQTGAASDTGNLTIFYGGGNRFENNDYVVSSTIRAPFAWGGALRTWSEWRAAGHDAAGSLTLR